MLKLVEFKPQKKEKTFVKNSLFSKEKFIKLLRLGGVGEGGEGRGNFITFSHTL
jgi:hypothetical protein